MESKVQEILTLASDATISAAIISSYKEVERNYFIKSWKTSELDAGHFVESVRRLIEIKLFGKYTPIGKNLPPFNEKTLNDYMQASGEDTYRIHLPRALLTIYGIRNKRGVGHLSKISPNHLDATFIINSSKWILGELIRENSNYSANETSKIVDHIIDRQTEGVWEHNETTRILADNLNLKEKIIFLLYTTNHNNDNKIIEIIETKDKNYFRKTIKKMHTERLLEFKSNGDLIISPKGISFAEQLILSKINAI